MERRVLDSMNNKAFLVSVLTASTLWLGAGVALAHAEKVSSVPEQGKTVAMPQTVSVVLSENPTNQSQFAVLDGCGRNVADAVSVRDDTLMTTIASDAQPGRWRAGFRVISAVDGHPTEDGWRFSVRGTPECSSAEEPAEGEMAPTPSVDDTPAPANEDDARAADTNPTSDTGDDGGFPVLPVALGAVALVGIAAIVRVTTSG